METDQIWHGRPSQVVNLGRFIRYFIVSAAGVALALKGESYLPVHMAADWIPTLGWALAAIGGLAIVGRWLEVRCESYVIDDERLLLSSGMLRRVAAPLELYRVRDYTLERGLVERMFFKGTVVLATSDRSHPVVRLRSIAMSPAVMDLLRVRVEACRASRGVRELDTGR